MAARGFEGTEKRKEPPAVLKPVSGPDRTEAPVAVEFREFPVGGGLVRDEQFKMRKRGG